MSNLEKAFADQRILVAALRDPRRFPHAVQEVEVIETHISWVLLAGEYAYKIKKALNLGFLDYSSLEARRFCCAEELRLNRRTAPDIYIDSIAIGGSVAQPVLGAQPAIEYTVRMRRFDTDALMDRMLVQGRVTPQHIDDLACAIAGFHAGSPVAGAGTGFGLPETISATEAQTFRQLRRHLTQASDLKQVADLKLAANAEFATCKRIFESRRQAGAVRECHGDLHLGNIVLAGDVPVLFDGIEFDPALRWIDVMDDIAFAVMDLLHRECPEFAWRLLNACLEASGDYGGVGVLRFYLASRATVRAKVSAIRAGQAGRSAGERSEDLADCRRYLALARRCLERHRPVLIITHGLPGSGKTTFSQLALQQTGAIRLRSDVERKRLFGLGALDDSRSVGADIYSPDATRRTYQHLQELARGILRAGHSVIVDAAFLRQDERESFRALARSLDVPFVIASLHASDATLHERIRQRQNDASEADAAVLGMLQRAQQPLSAAELGYTASFTTAEAPDSKANSRGWGRLAKLQA